MNEIDALNAAADKGVNKQQQQSSEMEYIGNWNSYQFKILDSMFL